MEKIGHRYVIQYFHLKGFSPTDIKAEIDSTLGESAPSFSTVKYWVAEFKRGRTSCQDEHRSGRPNEVTTPEMVKKIHKMVLDDRRIKVRELAGIVGISKSALHRILTESLSMRKLCARWVPRLLTLEQKQRREDVSIQCLAMLQRNKNEFLRRYITMDITSHLRRRNSQNNGLRRGKRLQRRQRQFHLLARLWRQFFGMRVG